MIYVTRLDGSELVVNADLIETVEHTADTVISLVDGKKLVVVTPVADIIARVIDFRRQISGSPRRHLRVVSSKPKPDQDQDED